jgi:DNA-binding phage protein
VVSQLFSSRQESNWGATVGFGELAEEMRCSPKSIMRMFSASGNPRAQNLLEIVAYLQQEEHVHLKVKAAAGK